MERYIESLNNVNKNMSIPSTDGLCLGRVCSYGCEGEDRKLCFGIKRHPLKADLILIKIVDTL